MKKHILPFLLLAQAFFAACQGNFQLLQMGDVPLENGQTIRNCKIGVRTFGKPNADTSNVVVLLPWYSGRSEYFAFAVGAEGLADSVKHYVIIIDPLGDGVSSSPSNSAEQPGAAFPEFSLSDMVNVQHELLTKRLGVRHVHLMSGYSMGGMACFDWAARHPGFIDKSAPICGSPKPSPFSRLFYQTVLTAAESGMGDSLDAVKALQTIGLLFALTTHSEDYVQQMTADSLYAGYSNGWANAFSGGNLHDLAWQMKAILHHDALKGREPAALPEMLIIVNKNDRDVHPLTCYEFAKKYGVELFELDSGFGHMSFFAEFAEIASRVRAFAYK